MKEYSNLSVLIIDPSPSMRGSLHNMLNQSNITKIEYAVSSGTAVRQVSKRAYDIILCEYDLGNGQDGQDGQQLLEDMRHHKLIGLWTIFIIITSERAYEKIVSAAELTPTDYILKPFTVEVLIQRIARAIEKRTAFLPVYQLIGQGNMAEAVKACDTARSTNKRYGFDFLRLQAELHLSMGALNEAASIYQQVMAVKPLAWAQLGLAKTLFQQEQYHESEEILVKLVAESDKFMDAYDWLAKTHEATGQMALAQKVLEGAVSISPHVVRRLRRLGEVAYEAGDADAAERSFKQVVSKAKYSEFRDPEDHVNLVKALVKKGDSVQAGAVIRDLEKALRGNPKLESCRALSSAMLNEAIGKADEAKGELNIVVEANRAQKVLSNDMKVVLARACLDAKMDDAATEVLFDVVGEAGSSVTVEKALGVLEQAGREDLAASMQQTLQKQAVELMTTVSDKSKSGDYKGATILMLEAVRKAPGNARIIMGAVASIIKQLDELGWEHPVGETARLLLEKLRLLEPNNPGLGTLTNSFQGIKRKYGIAG